MKKNLIIKGLTVAAIALAPVFASNSHAQAQSVTYQLQTTITTGGLNSPAGVAVDNSGHIFVANSEGGSNRLGNILKYNYRTYALTGNTKYGVCVSGICT